MRRFLVTAAALAIASASHAATLDGDTVSFSLENENMGNLYNTSFQVGNGVDASDAQYGVDMNTDTGNGKTGFALWVEPHYSTTGMVAQDGSITTLIFSDLNFSNGKSLVDFIVTDSNPVFSSFEILSGDTIAFHFVEAPFTLGATGLFLAGEYVLSTPLPAGGLLLLGGLGALGVAARRRRQAAA